MVLLLLLIRHLLLLLQLQLLLVEELLLMMLLLLQHVKKCRGLLGLRLLCRCLLQRLRRWVCCQCRCLHLWHLPNLWDLHLLLCLQLHPLLCCLQLRWRGRQTDRRAAVHRHGLRSRH